MALPKTMQESEKLYQEIKVYFGADPRDQVIEISDRPISEWLVHYTESEEDMYKIRLAKFDNKSPNAVFVICDDNQSRYFYFSDGIMSKSEDFITGGLDYFSDLTFSEFDIEKIRSELKEFMKVSG